MTLADALPKPETCADEPQERAVPAHTDGERETDQVRARMQALFRHSIREGLVNPLLHLVPPYRLGDTP